MMIKKQAGFTMVELLITMVVFVFVMAAASQIFSGLLTQFKQQSKISETNIEGVVGLEILRQDLEHVGYGLPWIIPAAVTYREATGVTASNYNDCNGTAPCNAPRGVVSGNNITFSGFTNVDYLVIKATNVALNDASQRWTTLKIAPFTAPENPRQWTPASENLASNDRVIVIAPGSNDANARRLIANVASFYTTFGNVTNAPWPPTDNTETHLVYGINTTGDPSPQRPFNRADYFIARTDQSGTNITPQRCAPNTGVLVKAPIKQDTSGNNYDTYLPLLDCVADMQIVYALDNDENGSFEDGVGTPADAYMDDITALTAQQVRNRVKEIRVYILAHEGQREQNYVYPAETIGVPAAPDPASGLGRTLDIKAMIGDPDYQHYRWKLYTLAVKPIDLR
jgi:prepilin-type N-terminal cleavage/methylation domain-containing protein